MQTIGIDLHEKNNESNLNFLGGQVGGLWGGSPLKIEIYPIFKKFRPFFCKFAQEKQKRSSKFSRCPRNGEIQVSGVWGREPPSKRKKIIIINYF